MAVTFKLAILCPKNIIFFCALLPCLAGECLRFYDQEIWRHLCAAVAPTCPIEQKQEKIQE